MAPLPHNNTAIYFVDYTTVGRDHTFELRASGGLSPAGLGAFIATFIGHLSADLNAWTFNTARFQAAGSTFSTPVVTGQEGLTFGSGAGSDDSAPVFLNFVGRSPGGRRVRLAVYGYKLGFSAYRVTAVENTHVADAINDLNTLTNGALAIDGLEPQWYPYANLGVNAYWQRQVRVGS